MNKKKTSIRKRRTHKGLNRRPEPAPAASLASRSSRPIVDTSGGEPSYYLDLADIALGHKPGPRRDQREKGKG